MIWSTISDVLADTGIHPSVRFVMQGFQYDHLPPDKQAISKLFARLAIDLLRAVPQNAELTVALRNLLTSKDAAVRATFFRTF